MDTNKFQKAIDGIRGMATAFEKLGKAMAKATAGAVPMKADKPGEKKERKKTQKGATHVVNPVFRARKISRLTPAQYRAKHAGVVRIVPSYLLPHAPPKWRNKWTSKFLQSL